MNSSAFPKPRGVRLEDGESLPEAIERAAAGLGLDFCQVTGFGRLASARIDADGGGEPVRFAGPLTLLSLNGRVRIAGDVTICDLVCTLGRDTDNGVQVLGGLLVEAETVFAELAFTALEVFEAGGSARERAARPAPAREAPPAGKPAATAEKAGKWADVIAESKRLEREGDEGKWDEEFVLPSRGDIVNHQQFGRCSVVKVDDEHISLRKPEGRIVQLGLAILSFKRAGEVDGKTAYDVEVRRG